jgi:hypothetical protein
MLPCSRFTPATIPTALPTNQLQAFSLPKVGDGPFIRRSTKTRSWEKAEDFKRKLEEEYEAKQKGLEEAGRPGWLSSTSQGKERQCNDERF